MIITKLPKVSVGSGPSTLAMFISERGEPEGAEFIISVDGTQIGGVQTTTADNTQGMLQEFDVLGAFPRGANTVSINYLNAHNSVLSISSATINGTPVSRSALNLTNNGTGSFGFVADGALIPIVVGSGPDTLALTMAERGEPTGAHFTISVNGVQIGGVQTTTADLTTGSWQTFDLNGSFSPGVDTVAVTYLNASNSVLVVQTASINGLAIPNSSIALSNNGSIGFSFTGPEPNGTVTIGMGPDVLALAISERGQSGGAQFTIDVNGTQVGGVQTTTADSTINATQTFDVLGNFPAGNNDVIINYLNASNSLLNVAATSVDGVVLAASALTLSNIGSGEMTFTAPARAPAGMTLIGSGPNTLALTLSQRGQPSGALFTVNIDGTQVAGVQSVTADTSMGQTQTLDVLGNFGSGTHSVFVNYLNASNSVLSVDSAAIDGAAIAGGSIGITNVGSLGFTFEVPADGKPVSNNIPNGVSTQALTLNLQSISASACTVNLATNQMAVPLSILPFGDSVTAGWTQLDTLNPGNIINEAGYRGPLWYKFLYNNIPVNFIGPDNNGPASFPNPANAGYPGYTTGQLLGLLPGILTKGAPQDVLLLAGANDLAQAVPQATTIANLAAMVNLIESVNPTTHIYLSQLFPLMRYSTTSLNDAISSLVSQLNTKGLNVSLVSQNSLTLADVGDDGVHPTTAGYALIAQNWYDAITAAQPGGRGVPAGVISNVSSSIANIVGGDGPEYLIGNSQANVITAGSGNDVLSGGGGIDTLIGGVGADHYLIRDVTGQTTIVGFNPAKGDYLDWSAIPGLIDAVSLAGVTTRGSTQTVVNLTPFGVDEQVVFANYTGSLANSQFLDIPLLTASAFGSGSDTLEFTMAERGEPAGAHFTVSVNGAQLGGVQSTAADITWGESQTFRASGHFSSGQNIATVSYLDGDGSMLVIENMTINGAIVPTDVVRLSNTGSASFTFNEPSSNAPVIVGEGAETLALNVSERGQSAGAEFTVDVDGSQIGGIQTTVADFVSGSSRPFNVRGNFGPGSHSVTVNYLNASNSLLNISGASIDGSVVPSSALTLSNIGSGSFSFMAPGPTSIGMTVIGTGPDTLALGLSQSGLSTNFTIAIDGNQVGGIQTVTANSLIGQTQTLDIKGSFGSGPHTATIDYLNAAKATLALTSATIDGSSLSIGSGVLNSNGMFSFVFKAPSSLA